MVCQLQGTAGGLVGSKSTYDRCEADVNNIARADICIAEKQDTDL